METASAAKGRSASMASRTTGCAKEGPAAKGTSEEGSPGKSTSAEIVLRCRRTSAQERRKCSLLISNYTTISANAEEAASARSSAEGSCGSATCASGIDGNHCSE